MVKERLRIQRQRSQQQSGGDCRRDDAEHHPTSATSESLPATDSGETPAAVQSPVKGRRFQRSRHAEQQAARSRSQDAVTTGARRDGFLGCTSASRPLQKCKSVEMNLERIVPLHDRRSNTVSVEVERLAAAAGGRKAAAGKKGSFLFRSSSLLARLSGRSGHKKLRDSPRRGDGPRSAADDPDDSVVGTCSANQSGTSSTLSKTASFSEPAGGHLETVTSSDSAEVERIDSQTTVACVSQPALIVQCRSERTDEAGFSVVQSTNDGRTCGCRVTAVSRPPRADSVCRQGEKSAALEHGTEIVRAAEMRRGLARQASDGRAVVSRTGGDAGCCGQPAQTARKLGGRRVSTSAGNLLNRTTQDPAGGGSEFNGRPEASTSTSVAAAAPLCDRHASLDAVTMTTTSADQQHGEHRLKSAVNCTRLS